MAPITSSSAVSAFVAKDPQAETILRSGESILLVEDEIFVRTVTSQVLTTAGYHVSSAKNAADASSIYEQHNGNFDLLVSDVVMPGENGRSLAARLQKNDLSLGVLLVSGYGAQIRKAHTVRKNDEMEIPGESSLEYLAKPFSADALLAKVRQVLACKSPGQKTASRSLAVSSG